MAVVPEPTPDSGEGSNLNGVKAAFAVGGIMILVYLLSNVLQVYENELLNSVYRYPDEFAFLRGLFPSPWSTDLIDWQDVVLFQLVPFLLFFYFAVRMRITALGRIIPMVIAMMVVGACLLVVRDFIGVYQSNISSLLLSGSFTLHNMSQSNPLSGFLSSILHTFRNLVHDSAGSHLLCARRDRHCVWELLRRDAVLDSQELARVRRGGAPTRSHGRAQRCDCRHS